VKKKILMVDDEERVRYTVKNGLELIDDSYDVRTAKSGEACFQELSEEQPDLILLDINMPGMSGWSVFKKIRDNVEWGKIPIIFLTARTDQEARKAGRFFAEAFMEKPVDIKELKKRIDEMIDKE